MNPRRQARLSACERARKDLGKPPHSQWRLNALAPTSASEKPEREMISSDELDDTIDWLNEKFAFILPEEPAVDCILNLAKVLVFRKGIRGLVIDPWNELEHSRPPNLTETEYISQALSRIRSFARTHDVHVWVVAHPTKLQKDRNGEYPVPTPYDISGSAHWRNKADNCLCVWRDLGDKNNRVVEVHIQKVRFSDIGRAGEAAELIYHLPTGKYFDVEALQEMVYE
jgi:twinkle protein